MGKSNDLEKELLCDFAQELIDALGLLQPEFAVKDVDLGAEIGLICNGEVESHQKRDS